MSNVNSENSLHKKYLISQMSAGTALVLWFPAMARCIYTEANFINPNFNHLYHNYFGNFNHLYHNYFGKFKNNYKGITPFAFAQIFYPILDLSTSQLSKVLANHNKVEFKHNLCSSMIVGAGSAFIYNPFKAVVVNMQTQSTMLNSIKYLYNNFGMKGFYTGTTFFVARNMTFCPCLLILSNYFEKKFQTDSQFMPTIIASKVASFGLPTLMATTVSMSADVFNTLRLTDPLKKKYKSNLEVMKSVYQTQGFSGFFSGYKWRLLATGIEFIVYNKSKDFYSQYL